MNLADRFALECRVHAWLDARRDPLDDPEVVAWLESHPEDLEAFARVRAVPELLRGADRARGAGRVPAARRGSRVARVAALLLVLAVPAAWWILRPAPRPPSESLTAAQPPAVARAELVCSVWTPEASDETRVSLSGSLRTRRQVYPSAVATDAGAPVGVLRAVIETQSLN